MIAIDPEMLQAAGPRFVSAFRQMNFVQCGKPIGKIRQQIRKDFTLITARPQDMSDLHPPGI
jgi:hypothetical protein